MGWKMFIKSKTAVLFLILYLISFTTFLFFSLTEDSLRWQDTTSFCNGNDNFCSFSFRYVLPIFYVIGIGPFSMMMLAFEGVPILAWPVLFAINVVFYTFLGYCIGFAYGKINRKWLFWIGIGLIITIIVMGYLRADTFYFKLSSEKSCETGLKNLFLRLVGDFDQEECYGIVAVQTKNIKVCEKIMTIRNRDSCFNEMAVFIPEYSLCEDIQNTELKSVCTMNVAIKRNECDTVADQRYKDLCYSRLSESIILLSKFNCCEKTEFPIMRALCLDYKNNPQNFDFCSKIKDEKIKNECVVGPVGTVILEC